MSPHAKKIITGITCYVMMSAYALPCLANVSASEAGIAPAKPSIKFMTLPPRSKHGVAARTQLKKSYSLSSVAVQKPKAANRHTPVKVAKEMPTPMDGDNDKLLLYVYDEMR